MSPAPLRGFAAANGRAPRHDPRRDSSPLRDDLSSPTAEWRNAAADDTSLRKDRQRHDPQGIRVPEPGLLRFDIPPSSTLERRLMPTHALSGGHLAG